MAGCFRRAVFSITQKTNAIMKKDSPYYQSEIREGEKRIRSPYQPEQIIDHNCIITGATLKGRRDAAKQILKVTSKVPVQVVPEQGIYMLPTASVRSPDCVWLSYFKIAGYEKRDHKTYVTFHDGTGMFINASVDSLDKQQKKTSEIIVQLNRSMLFKRFFDS